MVVFAHTPPPFHGQSRMVQLMLEGLANRRSRPGKAANATGSDTPGLAGDSALECYHVNARLSRDLQDVGSARWQKAIVLLGCCLRAIWLRLRYRPAAFYFVPAAPLRASLYRDWLVMLLCRGFFRYTVYHWHAVGLGQWLQARAAWWERRISHALMDRVDLAIVLSEFNQADAQEFRPRKVAVVPNGIPDPCPDYERTIGPRRAIRVEQRRRILAGAQPEDQDAAVVRVLFLAHCTRDKGLFDAIEGVRRANQQLADQGSRVHLQLLVAGGFRNHSERAELERLLAEPEAARWLRYMGFAGPQAKAAAFEQADLFCFPTYFASEGQPLTLLEAMAFGLPIVTTRWRSIPQLLPPDYPGLVEPRHPEQVAKGLLALLAASGSCLRQTFVKRFTLEHHLTALTTALENVPAG
ncbi:MAG: glycosyltransferase family 4 protein [Verrucomicrobiota bacterium]|jgi:glycosyltransferase involved in cell wall biosynthesis